MGAWIETLRKLLNFTFKSSHPMWVRGLKHGGSSMSVDVSRSHPMWVRGLKLCSRGDLLGLSQVAPHVGAWIETLKFVNVVGLSV